MDTKTEIESFLKDFNLKMQIWNILFRDERGKNTQTLIDLEIRPIERKQILETLNYKDYSEGPIEENLYGGSDMWIFGKMIKSKEVYIKITMGAANSSVICISFHISEHPIQYPFK